MRKIFTLLCGLVLTAALFAQLPYNTTMTQSHYNNSSIVVGNDGASRSQNKWDGGVRLEAKASAITGSEWNWDDKFVIIALDQTSIPYQLTFQFQGTSIIASDPNWYVAESESKNGPWVTVWTATTPTTSGVSVSADPQSLESPIELSKSTKFIKLCYSGNYGGIYKNIKVTDQAYVNNPKVGDEEITSLGFGSNTISSGVAELAFDVEWCNVNALSVSSDNELFTVSPASFGGKAAYGTQTITVGYNRDQEIGEHSGTITLTNGSVTKTVTVSGTTTKREQAIHWNADLAATNFTLNAEDVLTGTDLATADNEEAEITYTSDNVEVIAVSEDGKTLYAIDNGTATITALASGNEIYNEGTDSKSFTVTSNKKQVIVWDQNFMSLKTNADPNTIELTATATSGGEVTYALEDGSDNCVTLNGSVLTITGTPGVAYIVATQAGGEINEEVWIAATARKQIKVRDPQSACDEYALADAQYTFPKGHKEGIVYSSEFVLEGKPTNLTFYAKRGGLQYLWTTQTELYVEQYANFGSGLEWRIIQSILPTEQGGNFGPYALEETATKIRFRTGEYAEQTISNISIPRKKELVVSESAIVETAERNVRWSKTISVSRSNVDVVDVLVGENCPFEVTKTSIGTDCADRGTETFEVFFTPNVKDSVYTGTITITDGKANPTTHTISLEITCTGYNQSIHGFELPASCLTTESVIIPQATATSGLEVVYLSSDSTIAYVENNVLVILSAGTVDIIAYQAGDERWNEASVAKTIQIDLTPVQILEAPEATDVATNAPVGMALLRGGLATVEGTFSWLNPDQIMTEPGEAAVLFTPTQNKIYDTATIMVDVFVTPNPTTFGEYTAYFCEGDSVEFAGVWYYDATEEPEEVVLEGANIYQGDSVVMLTIIVHPIEYVEMDEETMHTNETLAVEPNVWYMLDGEDEVLLTEAAYVMNEPAVITLIQHTTTEFGCEKTIVRYITITEATDFEQVEAEESAEKFIQNGTLYIRRGEMIYTISGERVK